MSGEESATITDEPVDLDAVDQKNTIAVLNLSGELVEIGYLKGNLEMSPYLKTQTREPVYMSAPEVALLIAALKVAEYEALGEPLA